MSKRRLGSFESRLAGLSLKDAMRLALRTVFTVAYEHRLQVVAEARVHVPMTKKDGSQSLRYRVMYRCALCPPGEVHEKIEVDHIKPVGKFFDWPPTDKTELTTWAEGLFCAKENLQALCQQHHREKSGREVRKRAKVRRKVRAKTHSD